MYLKIAYSIKLLMRDYLWILCECFLKKYIWLAVFETLLIENCKSPYERIKKRENWVYIYRRILWIDDETLTPTNFDFKEEKSSFSKISFCNCGSEWSCRLIKKQKNSLMKLLIQSNLRKYIKKISFRKCSNTLKLCKINFCIGW